MPTDVYVTEAHPWYQVWVDGAVYDAFSIIDGGPPLTWSQQFDVAAAYREGLSYPTPDSNREPPT